MRDSPQYQRLTSQLVPDSRRELTPALKLAFALPESGGFDALLDAISQAEGKLRR